MSFPASVASDIRATIDATVRGNPPAIPGYATAAVDRDGNEVFSHAAGKVGMSSSKPMDVDNVFWIASCTKMITGLACMQLVEQGKLKLDDADQLEDLCPELKTVQVLKKDGTLEPKKKGITLRMLLTHTAGFSYSFFHEGLRDWSQPVGLDEFSGDFRDMLQPLVFQPGEGWEYGVSLLAHKFQPGPVGPEKKSLTYVRSTLTGLASRWSV
jgi:CubicO group peptidase (beta-lactamase class C family)